MQAADLKHALSDWSDRSNWSDNMPMTDFPKPYRSFKNMRNRFQFGFGFGPFLVFLALGKQSAPGEKAEPTTLNAHAAQDRKSTRLNSSHANISYAVFCLKKKKILNSILI